MASSSSAEGSSTSLGSSLAGASDGSLAAGVGSAVLGHHDDPDVGAVLGGCLRSEIEIVVVVVVIVVTGHGDTRLGARRSETGQLGLFEVGLGATRSRQDGLHELLV